MGDVLPYAWHRFSQWLETLEVDMEDYLFSMALSVLLATVKNKARAKKVRAGLIKLRDALINLNLENMGG